MKTKACCCWDLEGPITIMDFASELSQRLNKRLKLNSMKYDMRDFFKMISRYDDYIVDIPGVREELNIPEYQPGDTLRLMAPLYALYFTDNDLHGLAKANLGLLHGCKTLMKLLHKEWEIFIISTTYSQFAHVIADTLNIPRDNVYSTELNLKLLKQDLRNINDSLKILIQKIFDKYLKNGKDLKSVIEELNTFFWGNNESEYIQIMNYINVRGGKRKEVAVEEISSRTGSPISEMIAVGDSITDINMLQRLTQEGGISVSFNGNRFSIKHANVAITTTNSLGVLPIFQEKKNLTTFLESWENFYSNFQNNPKGIRNGLVSKEAKNFFIKYNFLPEIVNLKNKSKEQLKEIIRKHERMRKIVRGWTGKSY